MMSKKGVKQTVFLAFFLCIFSAPAHGAEEVVYRLKWLFNVSTVGDLYADVHGYFKDNGLSVTVKPGGPERDAIKELELGYAQFGVASADQVIRALSKGASVRVIAQLFQINPLQWIYRPDKVKIDRLSDLKGKTIGITYGGNDETIMRTLLEKAGISEKQVRLYSVRYDYTPFYQRQVDLWPVYRNAQAVFIGDKLRDAGEAVAFFNPAAYGVQFVANSVVTSEKMLKEKPAVVQRFLSALLKGWRTSLKPENADKAIEVLQQFDKDTSRDVLVRQLVQTRQLIKPQPRTVIGAIDIPAWRMTEQIMLAQQQIEKLVKIEPALRPLSTQD